MRNFRIQNRYSRNLKIKQLLSRICFKKYMAVSQAGSYTFIPDNIYKPVNETSMESIKNSRQVFHDCYLVSSLEALSRSAKGAEILQNNIKQQINAAQKRELCNELYNTPEYIKRNSLTASNPEISEEFSCTFKDIDGAAKTYKVTSEDLKKYQTVSEKQTNPIVRTCEIAMSKLIEEHPSKKAFINRVWKMFIQKKFEYNFPSRFMEMFTGKKPISIGEKSLNLTMKKYKPEVYELLSRMAETPGNNYSFVAGSGISFDKRIKSFHCFTITNVNPDNKSVTLKNKRTNEDLNLSFDEFLKKFKYITGYFNETLE